MTPIAELNFLVAEDHGFQRWLMTHLLEDLGARSVASAGDGASALQALMHPNPEIDVVISDLDMPGMDGMELIRRMAERNHTAALIVVSAVQPAVLRSVETMAVAYGVNLVAAIRKPLNEKKLRDALEMIGTGGEGDPTPRVFTSLEVEDGLRLGQFEPFFQPKVEVKGRNLRGAEALARWRHPQAGFVPPAAFIGVIEATGLIDTLTRSIAKSALQECRKWRGAGLDLTVSINVSPFSLSDSQFADWLTTTTEAEGLLPSHVTCEVTETAAMQELGRILETLSRLRMRGFCLSLDDYGTGYSSLERLSNTPFTELKIDKTFVKKAASDAACAAIVESSVELGGRLGIATVAEGMETHREWEMLLGMNCPQGQGYYIARPMEGAHFLEWARARLRQIYA